MASWTKWQESDARYGETLTLSDGGTIDWTHQDDRAPSLGFSWHNVDATESVMVFLAERGAVEALRVAALVFAKRVMKAHADAVVGTLLELEAIE